ncbi:uncharacterized protein LOC128150665 [Harpia harpyja]|uniref:uncharacterized protein LOC128150665 n=1 Tax=Harpia harpyja TaxID=202280 RepID=UPI0022B099E9|nr:uncharacterized protein LOC128150665 [Harpia harpyja]
MSGAGAEEAQGAHANWQRATRPSLPREAPAQGTVRTVGRGRERGNRSWWRTEPETSNGRQDPLLQHPLKFQEPRPRSAACRPPRAAREAAERRQRPGRACVPVAGPAPRPPHPSGVAPAALTGGGPRACPGPRPRGLLTPSGGGRAAPRRLFAFSHRALSASEAPAAHHSSLSFNSFLVVSRVNTELAMDLEAVVWPSLESCVLHWAHPYERDWRVQRRATEVKKGLEHLTYKARLSALGLFVLGKSRLRGISSMSETLEV